MSLTTMGQLIPPREPGCIGYTGGCCSDLTSGSTVVDSAETKPSLRGAAALGLQQWDTHHFSQTHVLVYIERRFPGRQSQER